MACRWGHVEVQLPPALLKMELKKTQQPLVLSSEGSETESSEKIGSLGSFLRESL